MYSSEQVKVNIANNISALRISRGFTQAVLAEKLNYSDKSVSKWERAESIPDAYVLYQIAELFGVGIDYLISSHESEKTFPRPKSSVNRHIITMLSVILVWIIATLVFAVMWMVTQSFERLWMIYILALPVSFIVLLVFNCVWGNKKYRALIISALSWTALAALYLFLLPLNNNWAVFLIGVPFQAAILLWSRLKH